MSDLPDVLQNAEAYVSDFNTDEFLGQGTIDVTFDRKVDKVRVKRNLFEGVFRPATAQVAMTLRDKLVQNVSIGAPAMSMQVDYGDQTYVFIVKFALEGNEFTFTGRAEPKLI
jgi:hypothetical protein